jgi:hypothetical protein
MSRCARDETWQDNWLATKGLLAKWKALPLQPKPDMTKFLKDKSQSIVYPASDQDLQARALSELSVSTMYPHHFPYAHRDQTHFAKEANGDLFLYKLRTINDPGVRSFAYMTLGDTQDSDGDSDGDSEVDDDSDDDDDDNTKRDLGSRGKSKIVFLLESPHADQSSRETNERHRQHEASE